MSDIPWFALSPSPFSIIFWLVLIIWGARRLLRKVEYRRLKYLNALTDTFFVLGLVVLSTDLMWVLICALRFGSLYADSVLQLVLYAARDVAGMLFCYLLTSQYFKKEIFHFNRKTVASYLLNLTFLAIWFACAEGPWFTDWTYAIRYDYSAAVIWTAFFISHVIGKIIVWLIYYSLWES